MYQHGNPGSAEREVPSAARRSLAADGFAVLGFTDVLNRELSAGATNEADAILAQVTPVLASILTNARIPEFWVETHGEMLAFLRFFDGLTQSEIAERVGVSRPTVIGWRNRYVSSGVRGLEDERRSGRPRTIDRAKILAATLTPPPA